METVTNTNTHADRQIGVCGAVTAWEASSSRGDLQRRPLVETKSVDILWRLTAATRRRLFPVDPNHHRLQGVWRKIARADSFLLELTLIEHDVQKQFRDALDVERDGDVSSYRITAVPDVPAEYGLILGDALHNYRAALDHLAYQLIVAGGLEPTDRTAFPLLDDPCKASALADIKPGLPEKVRRVLDSVQPCRNAEPADHPLRILHKLDIADKHHGLLPCVVSSSGAGWFGPVELIAFNVGPYAAGDIVSSARIDSSEPGAIRDLEHRVHVSVNHPAVVGPARSMSMSMSTYVTQGVRRYIERNIILPLSAFLD